MSARIDELDIPSREFYERAKLKLSFSLFLAALGMMLLGISAQSGGNSRGFAYFAEQNGLSGEYPSALSFDVTSKYKLTN